MTISASRELTDLLHWVREREQARYVKDHGGAWPYSEDKIIQSYRFCNVRREDDRVTRWIDENIRIPFATHPYLWFMLCIARQINWPDTLQSLIDTRGGWPHDGTFHPRTMATALRGRARRGQKVFTGAYLIPSPPTKGAKRTTWVAEHTLGNLWRDRKRISPYFQTADRAAIPNSTSLLVAHRLLMKYDCWGPFLAYQAVVDMRFTDLLSGAPDVDTYAAAGPGTVRGLNRIHGRPLNRSLRQEQALSEMLELAPIIREATGVRFDFSDVPNILCESDKYMRIKYGQGKVRARYVPGRGS